MEFPSMMIKRAGYHCWTFTDSLITWFLSDSQEYFISFIKNYSSINPFITRAPLKGDQRRKPKQLNTWYTCWGLLYKTKIRDSSTICQLFWLNTSSSWFHESVIGHVSMEADCSSYPGQDQDNNQGFWILLLWFLQSAVTLIGNTLN